MVAKIELGTMEVSNNDSKREDLLELLFDKIENLRPKLLDLTRRNQMTMQPILHVATRAGPAPGSGP